MIPCKPFGSFLLERRMVRHWCIRHDAPKRAHLQKKLGSAANLAHTALTRREADLDGASRAYTTIRLGFRRYLKLQDGGTDAEHGNSSGEPLFCLCHSSFDTAISNPVKSPPTTGKAAEFSRPDKMFRSAHGDVKSKARENHVACGGPLFVGWSSSRHTHRLATTTQQEE